MTVIPLALDGRLPEEPLALGVRLQLGVVQLDLAWLTNGAER